MILGIGIDLGEPDHFFGINRFAIDDRGYLPIASAGVKADAAALQMPAYAAGGGTGNLDFIHRFRIFHFKVPFVCGAKDLGEALRRINVELGLGIGARHITLSSCGIIGGIERLAREPEQFTLAISLHSAIQETRDTIMPGVKAHPHPRLRQALNE